MRRGLIVIGVLVMLYAVIGAVTDLGGKIGGVLIFLAAVLVVHDGIWLPLVSLAGRWLKGRGVKTWIVATALTVTALPLALGLGRTADNPSALPLHYARNLALLLVGVVTPIGLIVVARRKNRARADAHNEEADERQLTNGDMT